ncbi:hypothetical protein OIU76_025875 [Salix suchowensis]|nr:hypothetical protein OIU76_025875 [Salix suchowensis]
MSVLLANTTSMSGEPTGVLVSVEPGNLEFKKLGEEKTFKLTFKLAPKWKLSSDVFGILTWSDGKHFVRSPSGREALLESS